MAFDRKSERDFDVAQRNNPSWPVVISEGDSWFSFGDVIGQLDDPLDHAPNDQRKWALLRLEEGGAEIMTILSGSQRSKLRRVLKDYPRIGAVLFSGGGNDIIGPDLLPLLNTFTPAFQTPQDCVNTVRFERRLRQILDCYRELLDMLTDNGSTAKLFVNSYDHLTASGEGVRVFGLFKVAGPWLRPHLLQRGIPESLHGPVLAYMIDRFCDELDNLALESIAAGRLIRVETRGMVGKDFKDEIHPNRKGAKRVAKAFEKALKESGIL